MVTSRFPGGIAVSVLLATWACGSAPTAPSGSDVVSVQVSCGGAPPGQVVSLLVGQIQHLCNAEATLQSGTSSDISAQAVWSVSNPQVASVRPVALPTGGTDVTITALAPGDTIVSAAYGGRTGRQSVTVTAEDHLRFGSAASQGDFRPGTAVTMWAIGDYAVSSAESGELTLQISDEKGIVATASMTALKNFNPFVIQTSFTVPSTSVRLCPAVVLQVGSKTLSQTQDAYCETVRR